jgi:type IV pilus assembly protein PilF
VSGLPLQNSRIFWPLAAAAAAALPVLMAAACAPASGGPQAQSPERRAEAEYDLAREYFYKGNARTALDHALKATQLDDHNAKALYFTAAIYLAFCSGDEGLKAPDCKMKEAEKFARTTLDRDPTFRDARNMLGNILILEENFKEAITTLEPLVKDPSYNAAHLAWGNLGWAQVQDGRVDEGIASLRNAVTQPKFCVGFYHLGVAYQRKGDLAQAEQNLTQALQVDSPDCHNLQDAWRARGEVRLKLGRTPDACADFNKCRDLSGDTDAGKSCAQLLLKSACGGQPQSATLDRKSRRWT